jgi:hypothetical protein
VSLYSPIFSYCKIPMFSVVRLIRKLLPPSYQPRGEHTIVVSDVGGFMFSDSYSPREPQKSSDAIAGERIGEAIANMESYSYRT